eukprot:scaffold7989_cov111-Skeletonema_dohrnii-CCMP3373.AAC.4
MAFQHACALKDFGAYHQGAVPQVVISQNAGCSKCRASAYSDGELANIAPVASVSQSKRRRRK